MTWKLPVAKPQLNGNETKYLQQAIAQGEVSSRGTFVTRFEEAFADYIGTKYAVSCSSGTAALTLALSALDIGKGDEVIVPEFTMVASAWAVSYVGATPVFVDCDDNLLIDVNLIKQAITEKTKAIMPVHVYGRVACMTAIENISQQYNIPIIEDCAEAHGAVYNLKKVGSIGDMGCFSFFGNKIITTGEGGMITTNDAILAEKLRYFRSMAFDPEHTFLHKHIGYNFRMSNLQAAVGLAQLEQIEHFLDTRKSIEAMYDKFLNQITLDKKRSVLWYYDIVLENKNQRDLVMHQLKKDGIETRVFFKPMSMQPMYLNNDYLKLKAYKYAIKGMYLPTFIEMTEKDVMTVCRAIDKILKK